MRVAERAALHQATGGKRAGHGMQHRHIQRLARAQRWQQAGKPRRKHGFARPGRPDHQQVVRAGGGDFQNPAGRFLAAKIGHIRNFMSGRKQLGPRHWQHLPPAKVIQQCHQVGRRNDRQVRGPGRFRAAALRTDQVQAAGDRRHG